MKVCRSVLVWLSAMLLVSFPTNGSAKDKLTHDEHRARRESIDHTAVLPFDVIDTDKNTILSEREVRGYMLLKIAKMQTSYKDHEHFNEIKKIGGIMMEKIIQTVKLGDLSGDGELSRDEFDKMMDLHEDEIQKFIYKLTRKFTKLLAAKRDEL